MLIKKNFPLFFKVINIIFFICFIFLPGLLFKIGNVNAQEIESLSIEKYVDKSHVQRDLPEEGAQDVTYTLIVKTDGYCNASLDIGIAFDKSGSMVDEIDLAKQATISFINELDSATDMIGLIPYDTNAYLAQPLTSIFLNVINNVNTLNASGNTNIGEALLIASQEIILNGRPDSQKVILIFTDGQNNSGYTNAEVITIADTIKNQLGIRIISVGIGDGINENLLLSIASSIEDYYWVADVQDLEETFIDIARQFQYGTTDIEVSDDISSILPYTDFISASDNGYLEDGVIKWDFGVDICLSKSKTVSFVVRVKKDTPDLTKLLNSANVIDTSSGLSVTSNTVETVVHAPILEITKTNNLQYVLAGEDITYYINVKNTGTGNAYDVYIKDKLPDRYLIIYSDRISDNGYIGNNEIIWDNNGRGYIVDGSFEPSDSFDSIDSDYTFSYSGKISEDCPSGEKIRNTVTLYSYSETYLIESVSTITVSAILAVTGRNITLMYFLGLSSLSIIFFLLRRIRVPRTNVFS